LLMNHPLEEPLQALQREEFEELRRRIRLPFYRVIVDVLFFSAARISEALMLTRDDIKTVKYRGYDFLLFHLKTLKRKKKKTRKEKRKLQPVRVVPCLKEEVTPETLSHIAGCRGFIFSSPWRSREALTRQAIFKKLKRIDPRLYPYVFRHSRLTDLACVLNEYELSQVAGWKLKHKTARHYIYLNWASIADKIILKKENLDTDNWESSYVTCYVKGRILVDPIKIV